jgi:fatty-acyl-CoA synthase
MQNSIVPISTRFKAFEAEYILRQSDTSTLIMVDIFLNNDFMTMMHEICPEIGESSPGGINSSQFPYLKNVIVDSKKNYKGTFKFEELFNWGSDSGYEEALRKARSVVGPDDIAIIAYTSGTTGSPKGAMLTHDSVSRHLLFVSERIGLDKKDRVLFGFPLYHLGGCVTAVMPPLLTGACLLTPEYFDPEEAMRIIEKEKCTTFFGVHTMVQMIIEHPNFGKYNLKSLKKGVIGGAACPTKLIEDIIAKLGYTPLNFYGMTECATCTTGTPKDSTPPRSLRPSGKPQMITR